MSAVLFPRSKAEIDEEIKVLRQGRRERLKSKESALAFLVRAGILTKSGRLTKHYRTQE